MTTPTVLSEERFKDLSASDIAVIALALWDRDNYLATTLGWPEDHKRRRELRATYRKLFGRELND